MRVTESLEGASILLHPSETDYCNAKKPDLTECTAFDVADSRPKVKMASTTTCILVYLSNVMRGNKIVSFGFLPPALSETFPRVASQF